jgi:tRNA-specific 2-thiouridylase
VIVGPKEALETSRLVLRDVNWLGDLPLEALPEGGMDLLARVRSTREPVPARIEYDGAGLVVTLTEGEGGVAPGQACVFYDAADPARVLGGGWIARTESRWQMEEAASAATARVAAAG